MIMIRSIVRPENADNVLAALMEAGFPGITKMSVVGRGKQRGIKIGEITYDEIPKEMILAVVKDQDKDFVIKTIMGAARTGDKGAYGDNERGQVSGGRQKTCAISQPFKKGSKAPLSPATVNWRYRIMLLRHTPKEITERSALTINPAKTCQPIGAMYAALGIHGCPSAQSWIPGLLCLPSQRPDPSFQGAGHGCHQRIYRRRYGLWRPGQPASGH